MCGTPGTQNVTNTTSIPAYQQDYAIENENAARDIAARPYVPYTGQRVANFNPLQNTGFNQIATNATGAPESGAFDTGIQTATAGQASKYGDTLTPGDVAPWMSPYIEGALKPQLAALARNHDATARSINAGSAAAGAFGDARTGVQQGENDRNTGELRSNVYATGYQNAFDRAMAGASGAFTANTGQFNADRAAQLAAADEAGRLATTKYGYQKMTGDDLLSIGKTQQDFDQANLTMAYQDFINQFEYPQEMLNLRLATQAGSPYGTTRLTQTPYSPTAQGIGALSALYGLVGKPAGATTT